MREEDLTDFSGDQRVAVPSYLLSKRSGEHYVLRVVGNSMIDELIADGDFVIVLRREVVEPGEMAVLLVGDDSTIKRVYTEGPVTRLVSANRSLQPVVVPTIDVRVQGLVVGVMRKF